MQLKVIIQLSGKSLRTDHHCALAARWGWWPEAVKSLPISGWCRVFSPYCETRLADQKIGNHANFPHHELHPESVIINTSVRSSLRPAPITDHLAIDISSYRIFFIRLTSPSRSKNVWWKAPWP